MMRVADAPHDERKKADDDRREPDRNELLDRLDYYETALPRKHPQMPRLIQTLTHARDEAKKLLPKCTCQEEWERAKAIVDRLIQRWEYCEHHEG